MKSFILIAILFVSISYVDSFINNHFRINNSKLNGISYFLHAIIIVMVIIMYLLSLLYS